MIIFRRVQIGLVISILRLSESWFLRTNKTPKLGFKAMRFLYGVDSGQVFTEWRKNFLARCRPTADPEVFGKLTKSYGSSEVSTALEIENEAEQCVRLLRDQGFYIFQKRLPEHLVQEIITTSENLPMISPTTERRVIGLEEAKSSQERRLDFNEQEIVKVGAISSLLTNRVWAQITANYLDSEAVVQDQIAMWMSLPSSNLDRDGAAQMYHFDLDRPGFLKFFILLTDVDMRRGPHVLISGTNSETPTQFRKARRFSDEEVEQQWPNDKVSICGSAGTIFAVDTKCLHKGLALEEGHRLILQFEFSDSLFGAPYTEITIDKSNPIVNELSRRPTCFQRFKVST